MPQRTLRAPLRLIERVTQLSYPALFSLWILTVGDFALLYFLLTTYVPWDGLQGLADMDPLHRLLNSIYFSIITATSIGYGDIVPLGFSRAFAAAEGISAFGIFGIFLAKIVSRKQEYALSQIHRLTYENILHKMREGLFITRRDIDALLAAVEEHRALTPRQWENLTTAYLHVQSFIEDIPNFYDEEHRLYTIDPRRERLLAEAVLRTLDRFHRFLTSLDAHAIDWRGHSESREELQELIRVTEQTVPIWRERARAQQATIDRIGTTAETLRKVME